MVFFHYILCHRVDYDFVEKPSEEFFCPVTKNILLQPHLTSCCGRHLSREVATELQKGKKRCPLCKAVDWSTIWDKRFQREVKSLHVFCSNKNRGCEWQAELFSLDYHLQSCTKGPSQATDISAQTSSMQPQ